MKKLLVLVFFLMTQLAYSQNDIPLIERKGNLVQNQYFILGKGVSGRQVLRKMIPYEVAHKRMKSSRRWAFTSAVIGGIGIGAFMPTFFDPTPKITVASLITGVSLIAIAVPLKKIANRKADEAINLYNSRQLIGKHNPKSSLNLTLNPSGLGLMMTF